jgi:hypothetical protein
MARTLATILAVLAAIAAAVVWLLVSSFPDNTNTGYRVTMRPSAPLSQSACKAEIRRLQINVPNFRCPAGTDRPWFEITVTNVHDHNGYPDCQATAYNRAGQALFEQGVPIGIIGGEPSGPPVNRGTTVHLVWYFGDPTTDGSYVNRASWTPSSIRRYSAVCHGRPTSQVPV